MLLLLMFLNIYHLFTSLDNSACTCYLKYCISFIFEFNCFAIWHWFCVLVNWLFFLHISLQLLPYSHREISWKMRSYKFFSRFWKKLMPARHKEKKRRERNKQIKLQPDLSVCMLNIYIWVCMCVWLWGVHNNNYSKIWTTERNHCVLQFW